MTSSDLNDLARLIRSMHEYEMAMCCEVQDAEGATFDEMDEENQAKFANAAGTLLDGMLEELLAARGLINQALEMPELPEDD